MKPTVSRTTLHILLFASAALMLLVAACVARPEEEATAQVRLEPISTSGENPFSPPMGTDQSGVTPPQNAGGTFAGNTAGIYGGTHSNASCDPAKLVTYLQENQEKAAAWAGVLGIRPADIPAYVATLTPALLRSDTSVTNHGFLDGRATTVPSVLQAGTAVLVDRHGAPVTKCFCGNPLTPPASLSNVTFVGVSWATFVSTSITVIQPVNIDIDSFVFVDPSNGDSFERPSGTAGQSDGQPTRAPVTPAPTATGPPATGPPATGPPATGPPATGPPGTGPPGTGPPATGPTSEPSPPTGSPPTGSQTGEPPPTSESAQVVASWVIGDCYVADGTAYATVLVRNEDDEAHTFDLVVTLGPSGEQSVTVAAGPGETGETQVSADASGSPDGPIDCAIVSIVDENGEAPLPGEPLAPPPDTQPEPPITEEPTEEPPVTEEPTEEPPVTEEPTEEPPITEEPSVEPS